MRILLVNYEFPPLGGGAATATAQIAGAMARQGHEVTVLTAASGRSSGIAREEGVEVIRLRCGRARIDRASLADMAAFVARAAAALSGVLRRARPQLCIVFFSLPCGPLGPLAKMLAGVRYVISLRGGDVPAPGADARLRRMHRLLAPVRRWVLRGAAAIVANSRGLRDLSQRTDPFPVAVIGNGVDTSVFVPRQRAPGERFRFLFVGRLSTEKNVALLLTAVRELLDAPQRSFELTIVGDGPLAARLRAGAERLGLGDVIEWRGWLAREDMPACYAGGDCLVNPSVYEGMPNAVLEAMACGIPVIASDVAGNADLVQPGITGLLFRSNDPVALAGAMRRMLDDPDEARRLGRAARAAAMASRSWDAVARDYVALAG